MFHTINSIAPTHQRPSSSLPFAPFSFSLSTYFLIAPLSLYRSIFLFLPPLPSSSFNHSFLSLLSTSLLPPHSFSFKYVSGDDTLKFYNTMKRALRVLKLEKFFRGRTPPPRTPSGWTGCHYRPTSAPAAQFDTSSLHPGATLHFAQSQKEFC